MYTIWSSAYLDFPVCEYTCYVNEKEWVRLHNDFNTSKMFVRIIKDDVYWICALNSPISGISDKSIYVPMWMLSQIYASGDGEPLQIEFMPTEAFDHSEKIVLQALNNVEVEDIQELLSNELTKLAILQKNTIITVKLDYEELLFRVVRLEPASVVLCEGDEVELEFYEEAVPTSVERSVAINPTPEVPAPVRFNPWRNKDFKPYIS
jgi:hypothetical protein